MDGAEGLPAVTQDTVGLPAPFLPLPGTVWSCDRLPHSELVVVEGASGQHVGSFRTRAGHPVAAIGERFIAVAHILDTPQQPRPCGSEAVGSGGRAGAKQRTILPLPPSADHVEELHPSTHARRRHTVGPIGAGVPLQPPHAAARGRLRHGRPCVARVPQADVLVVAAAAWREAEWGPGWEPQWGGVGPSGAARTSR